MTARGALAARDSDPRPTDASVESPSGKDAAYENFPVGSFLLPRRTRRHVAIFYAFARAADDIADSADLEAAEKVARLDGFEAVLLGLAPEPAARARYAKAARMRESLNDTHISPEHCVKLLSAFRQDATKTRYRDWPELIDYCDRSAAPVGRYLIDLHGGSPADYPPADALCNALQVLNHLQDCKDDFLALDRVYIPSDWMTEAGIDVRSLDASITRPELRVVFDRMIAGINDLLRLAAPLPGRLSSRRLALESEVILRVAWRLSSRLSRRDPLARRVVLGPGAYAACFLSGIVRGLARR